MEPAFEIECEPLLTFAFYVLPFALARPFAWVAGPQARLAPTVAGR